MHMLALHFTGSPYKRQGQNLLDQCRSFSGSTAPGAASTRPWPSTVLPRHWFCSTGCAGELQIAHGTVRKLWERSSCLCNLACAAVAKGSTTCSRLKRTLAWCVAYKIVLPAACH